MGGLINQILSSGNGRASGPFPSASPPTPTMGGPEILVPVSSGPPSPLYFDDNLEAYKPTPTGLKLEKWIGHPNIAEELDEELLTKIASRVINGYEVDKQSRSDWEEKMEQAMKLAMQVMEHKTTPWPGCSNVKYPLLTVGALQFNARAGAVIVQGDKIVRGMVVGRDPDGRKAARADRVAAFLNWQLLDQMPEWEEETDKLLMVLPILGSCFKKIHPDPVEKRPRSDFVDPFDLVVNYHARSISDAPRITHKINLYRWEVQERINKGLFRDLDYNASPDENDAEQGDEDAPIQFIEQHCRFDLDEDGYQEPYVVWLNTGSLKIARIVARYTADDVFLTWGGRSNQDQEKTLSEAWAVGVPGRAKITRIEPINYFTRYLFLPSPDGCFYGKGLGELLYPINESINTLTNQLIDAGTLQNIQGGFADKTLKIPKGEHRVRMGEWVDVNVGANSLKDSLFPFSFQGPSQVLYTLLDFLVSAGENISSIKDIMLGDLPSGDMPATTTLAAIEQAVKLFTGIFKRTHQSLRDEISKIIRLDRYLITQELYQDVLDEAVTTNDFDLSDRDIRPITDPSIVSNTQKMLKAQLLLPLAADPRMNYQEIMKRYFDATEQSQIEKLFANPAPPQPNPDMLKLQFEQKKFGAEFALKAREVEAKIKGTIANAILAIAKAEAEENGTQLAFYKQHLDELNVILRDVQDQRRLLSRERAEGIGPKQQGPPAPPTTLPRDEQVTRPDEEQGNEAIGMGGLEIPSGNEDVLAMASLPPERATRGTLPNSATELFRQGQRDIREFSNEIESKPY